MIRTISDFVRDVRVAIDMNSNSNSLLSEGDADTLQLDEIIESKLADAVMQVEKEAPSPLLEYGHDFVDLGTDHDRTIEWGEGGRGTIILPDDFMRFVAFRMSDWKKAVYSVITDQDPTYAMVTSKYRGISGNTENPVVAIVHRAEGLALEFYTCDSEDAKVVQATYIPYPKIVDGGIDVSEKCYSSAVYRAAFLTLASVGEQNANAMLEISKSLLV